MFAKMLGPGAFVALLTLSVEALELNKMFDIPGCGRTLQPLSRIQDGDFVDVHILPWMIGVASYQCDQFELHCSGFIVSAFNAITAGHCILESTQLFVTFGSRFWEHGSRRPVDSVYVVSEGTSPNTHAVHPLNVAILGFDAPFEISRFVAPICIASNFPYTFPRHHRAFIAGFGSSGYRNRTDRLHMVKTFLHSPAECPESSERRPLDPEMEICAVNGLRGPCPGDYGGPLMVMKSGTFYAIGVMTYGPDCPDAATHDLSTYCTRMNVFQEDLQRLVTVRSSNGFMPDIACE